MKLWRAPASAPNPNHQPYCFKYPSPFFCFSIHVCSVWLIFLSEKCSSLESVRRKRASVTPQRETFKSALMTIHISFWRVFLVFFHIFKIKCSLNPIFARCVLLSVRKQEDSWEKRGQTAVFKLSVVQQVASAESNRYFSHKRQLNQCLQSYSAGNRAAL